MIKKITIGNVRLSVSCARIARVTGVNSRLDDNNHIIAWDFDNVPLDEVKEALARVQARYFLSDIIILRTKEPDNYHAYCFTRVPWRRAVEIVAATENVDWAYLRYSVWRYHFTLRVTSKDGRDHRKVAELEGYELPTATVDDLNWWTEYETRLKH